MRNGIVSPGPDSALTEAMGMCWWLCWAWTQVSSPVKEEADSSHFRKSRFSACCGLCRVAIATVSSSLPGEQVNVCPTWLIGICVTGNWRVTWFHQKIEHTLTCYSANVTLFNLNKNPFCVYLQITVFCNIQHDKLKCCCQIYLTWPAYWFE